MADRWVIYGYGLNDNARAGRIAYHEECRNEEEARVSIVKRRFGGQRLTAVLVHLKNGVDANGSRTVVLRTCEEAKTWWE